MEEEEEEGRIGGSKGGGGPFLVDWEERMCFFLLSNRETPTAVERREFLFGWELSERVTLGTDGKDDLEWGAKAPVSQRSQRLSRLQSRQGIS